MTACKRQAAPADGVATSASGTVVALGGNDVGSDGRLAPGALQQLEQQASAPALDVTFVRTPLSDAGLQQLEKFHNLRRVEAVGSKITAQGVAKLKSAVPEVEVIH